MAKALDVFSAAVSRRWSARLLPAMVALGLAGPALSQLAPSAAEIEGYRGLHRAAWAGDVAAIGRLVDSGEDPGIRDGHGRTPLHVAAYASRDAAVRALVEAGADPNAVEDDRYDVITIAAVADDPRLLRLALALGGDPRNITSPYDGTALIAAAHLGHVEVVNILIEAGAPLDHVNNLGWTALIEAVVLGDGGPAHRAVVRALLEAGADPALTDGEGATPLALAQRRGYGEMVRLLEAFSK